MSEEYIKSRHIWKDAALVSAAALIGKVLSALYRVPYQNITGDVGYYVYQQVYPFYGAAMMVSMYGFPVILSKMVEEAKDHSGEKGAREAAASVLLILAVLAVTASGSLFFLAAPLANIMGDNQLTGPLQVVAFAFLAVPVLSVGRGYVQGIGDVKPTAVSHVLEQIVRVSAILLLATVAVSAGQGPYEAGKGAAFGSVCGAAAGASFLFWAVRSKRIFFGEIYGKRLLRIALSHKIFLRQSVLVCAGAMIFILYQLADALTVIRVLQQSGMTGEMAKIEKGIFDRAMPLLQFGTVIAASLAMAIVPIITKEKRIGNTGIYRKYGTSVLRISLLTGAAAATGLVTVAEPANIMLFENSAGTAVLRLLALSLFFSGLAMTSAAVMQGHDFFRRPALHLGIGLFLKFVGNIYLIPLWGTDGAAAATIAGLALTVVLNIGFLMKKQLISMIPASWICKSGGAVLTMMVLVWFIVASLGQLLPEGRLWESLLAVFASGTGAFLFASMVIRFSLLTEAELAFIPGAEKWSKFIIKRSGSYGEDRK